jgi:hypothetical protein
MGPCVQKAGYAHLDLELPDDSTLAEASLSAQLTEKKDSISVHEAFSNLDSAYDEVGCDSLASSGFSFSPSEDGSLINSLFSSSGEASFQQRVSTPVFETPAKTNITPVSTQEADPAAADDDWIFLSRADIVFRERRAKISRPRQLPKRYTEGIGILSKENLKKGVKSCISKMILDYLKD